MAKEAAKTIMAPHAWWAQFGSRCKELQYMARRLCAQPVDQGGLSVPTKSLGIL